MDQSVIKAMVEKYMNEKLEEIKIALAAENFQELKSLGHKVKGNSGSLALGLTEINELGRVLEVNGGENNLAPCQEAYTKLTQIIGDL